MERYLHIWIAAAVLASVPVRAAAQASYQPTPTPIVSAGNEPWFLAGEPITYSGSVYYPAGPQVFFNGFEMVRSGDYRGIPLYSLTTIEPFSKVFVPLSGGLMQPYERRRAGDLAGTVGSTAPSFPVVTPAEQAFDTTGLSTVRQAAGPPSYALPVLVEQPMVAGTAAQSAPLVAGTAGLAEETGPRGPLRTAKKPEGLNGIYIHYRDRRWFSSGPAEEIDSSRFTRIGEYHGFGVYAKDGKADRTIYVEVTSPPGVLVAPYSQR
jgi:hypothetical protein